MNAELFDRITEPMTRSAGLGGSDARMVLRIAERGTEYLNKTDSNRLLMLIGKGSRPTFTSAATEAGHCFENWYAKTARANIRGMEREYRMEKAGIADSFGVVAHADFVTRAGGCLTVFELKYSQKAADEVLNLYMPQLQWYYWLGAAQVLLVAGHGSVEPFDCEGIDVLSVERQPDMFQRFETGVRLIDQWCKSCLECL